MILVDCTLFDTHSEVVCDPHQCSKQFVNKKNYAKPFSSCNMNMIIMSIKMFNNSNHNINISDSGAKVLNLVL